MDGAVTDGDGVGETDGDGVTDKDGDNDDNSDGDVTDGGIMSIGVGVVDTPEHRPLFNHLKPVQDLACILPQLV